MVSEAALRDAGTVKDGRSSPAPLVGVPVDWAQLVVAMTKRNGPGRSIRPHRVKGKNDLPATLCPAATEGGVVFADVLGGEHGAAIRSEVEGKDPFRRIRRRCVALVDAGKIRLVPLGYQGGEGGCKDPAKRQQGAGDMRTDKHDE